MVVCYVVVLLWRVKKIVRGKSELLFTCWIFSRVTLAVLRMGLLFGDQVTLHWVLMLFVGEKNSKR